MRKYDQYKPSKENWLMEIPTSWKSVKMKYLFSERSEKGFPDEPLLVASQNMGVVPKDVYRGRTVEASKDLHLLKLVKIDDFVISLRSFQGGIERAYYQGIISPAYTILVPHSISVGYFKYLGKATVFIQLLKSCVTGIREGQNIDYKVLKNKRIPVPPRPEQDQIVRFLDWKVSDINKLINIKKREIKELEELKRSRIAHIVMGADYQHQKPTSVSWVKTIPEDWKELSLIQVATEQQIKNIGLIENNLLSLSYGKIIKKDINTTDGLLPLSFEGYQIVENGNIILRLTDLQNDH
ncbi:MAG: restriction endonuclease subunit S, partial [Eubacterium sp.]|nr:restriction endonuclease subunit S [Eubacterium sp.]